MKNMKRFFSVLIILVITLVFAGCQNGAENTNNNTPSDNTSNTDSNANENVNASGNADKFPEDGWKVGIASREIVNDYNRGIIEGAKAKIEAAGGEAVVVDGQGDPSKHNENIANLINSDVKSIIIELGDAQQLEPLVQKAKDKGIDVVTAGVGAQVDGSLTEVGGDEALMAAMMGRALLQSINHEGDIYVFWVPGAPLLETRKRIFEAMVKDYPNVTLHEVPTEHNPAKVQSQMEDLLTANPDKGDIDGVWAAYDLLGSGASEAIRKAGRDEIKMTAIDGDKVGFSMLFQEGSPFVATVAQDVNYIGELAADALVKAANGLEDQISGTTFTNAYLATRHNGVKAAEMRWGEGFWDEMKIKKDDVISRYPQNEDVIVVRPIAP